MLLKPENSAGYTIQKISLLKRRDILVLVTLISLAFITLVRYLLWWFNPEHIPFNWFLPNPLFDLFIFAVLSFVVFHSVSQRLLSWTTLLSVSKPKIELPETGLKVAFITCYVPGKEPLDMLEKTLTAMVKVRYPHDTWVLDEGNDSSVKALCDRLEARHFSRKGIDKYNQSEGKFRTKTKAGNHNSWMDQYEHMYDFVAQIDMDHIPHEDYFDKTLGYFKDEKVAVVGMPQIYKNTDNWIARGAAEQGYFFHGPMQKGFYGADMPFLIGTTHIYRSSAMKKIGGYAPTIVEDHLTGMRFYAAGYKGVYVPEVLCEGEGPINWVDYFNQQMRWSFGLFEILFKHTPGVLGKLPLRQKFNYFLAQLYYLNGTAVFLGIILIILYLVFGIRAASMNLLEWILHATPAYVFANLIQIYARRFHIDPERESVFGPSGMFLNFAANIIYALAFLKFITGQKLRYMVTQKGENAKMQMVPLRTFIIHMIITAFMIFSLVRSFISGNDAIQLRFWAVFNILTLSAVALSIYYDKFKSLISKNFRYSNLFRYSLTLVAAFLFLVSASYLFIYRTEIAIAFSSTEKITQSNIFGEEQISGKIKAPPDGSLLGISLYHHNDYNSLSSLESKLNKHFAIVGFYQSWGDKDRNFNFRWAHNIAQHKSVPLISWEPWSPVTGFNRTIQSVDQLDFRLSEIISGRYDAYITDYAKDIKNYRLPVMIRFAHEMNGNWYPWSGNFNTAAEYIESWKHVHDIFDAIGATNVTWVWSPNEIYTGDNLEVYSEIDKYYPGDDYVDWVGFSAFNWAGFYKNNIWRDPEDLFSQTLIELNKFSKPVMITETGSADIPFNPNLKSNWINLLANYMKSNPEIKGLVWFNMSDADINWSLDSSIESQNAFSEAFKSDYFYQTIE